MARKLQITDIIDPSDGRFAEINLVSNETLEELLYERQDASDDRAMELEEKIKQLEKKEAKEGTLNNRDRRVLKKCEKQREELEEKGMVVAWIEDDIINAIEEAKDLEEEKNAKAAYQAGKKEAAAAPADQIWSDEEEEDEEAAKMRSKYNAHLEQKQAVQAEDSLEGEEAESDSYVKVSKEEAEAYAAGTTETAAAAGADSEEEGSDEEGSSDSEEDSEFQQDSDFDSDYEDFSSKKKQQKQREEQKKKQLRAAAEFQKANAHVKKSEDYMQTIEKKVEILKGKGKPIYTLAAKKLWAKGKGKAADLRGEKRAAAAAAAAAKGQGKGTGGSSAYSSPVGKGPAAAPVEVDEEEDEEEDLVDEEDDDVISAPQFDEWGDAVVDPEAEARRAARRAEKR